VKRKPCSAAELLQSCRRLAEPAEHKREALFQGKAGGVDADSFVPGGAARVLFPGVFLSDPFLALR
jgi:hypothetical protein